MHRLRSMPVTLAAAVLVAGAVQAALPPLLPSRPFTVGERLDYRIRLGPVVVGEASLEIVALHDLGDRTAYELRYTALSNGLLATLYPVRDRITSWADTLDFRSHRLSKRVREGRLRERCDLRLDHDSGEASSSGGIRLEIPPGCHDVFSALLRLRASRLAPESRIEIPVILGGAVANLRIRTGERRQVTVPAGEFTCIVLTPHLGGAGPFHHEGPVTVDLSQDGRKLPVRVTVRVPVVGRLQAELTGF